MKVKCVKNTYEKGFFSKKTEKLNITIGKVYDVNAVNFGFLQNTLGIDITMDNVKFLVFNDSGMWDIYSMHYFAPCN